MTYTVRATYSTVHIAGLGTLVDGSRRKACAAVTRQGCRWTTYGSYETAPQALEQAQKRARSTKRKMCQTCESAAS